MVLRKIALGLQPCQGKKMKSEIVKKGFVYISHYKEPWVRKRRHCMGPKTRLRRVGSKQPGHVDQLTWAKNMTRQNQHAEGQKSHASPTAYVSLMNQNYPQMRKEKNFSSMRPKKSVV